MAKRVIVGIIAAAVVVLLILAHGIPIVVASILLALGVQYELTKTIKLSGVNIVEPVTYGYTALVFPAYYFFGLPGVFLLLTLAVILVFVCDVVFKKYNFDNTMASVFTLIYPQLFFVFLYMVILVEDHEISRLILTATITCSVCTDTFAYFIGNFFGKHKLCPVISPNKTIEGAIGGIFGGVVGVIVVALLFDQGRIHLLEYGVLAFINIKWKEMLESLCRFMLVIGDPAAHVLEVCESYNSAVITLQKAFYYQPCEVLCSGGATGEIYRFQDATMDKFSALMKEGEPERAESFICNLTDEIRRCDSTPVSLVKDFYAKLFYIIPSPRGIYGEQKESERDLIFHSIFLTEIETLLLERIRGYFSSENRLYANPMIEKIERYISKFYGDPGLSLTTIAAELNLSSSYLCVLFKKETGMTLNHFITQYRMEQAKQALVQDDAKIKRIANAVGYNDCNYFIKAFKKANGVTPMEYREMKMSGKEQIE